MSKQQILNDIVQQGLGAVIFHYFQGQDSTVGGWGSPGVCHGMCYQYIRTKLQIYDRNSGVFVKDPNKASPVPIGANELPGERQAAPAVRFAQDSRNLLVALRRGPQNPELFKRVHGDNDETANKLLVRQYFSDDLTGKSALHSLLTRDGITETLIGSGNAYGIDRDNLAENLAGEFAMYIQNSNHRFFIVTLAKDNSGHAICFDVLDRAAGRLHLLDPNYGLLSFTTWENFTTAWVMMWRLYHGSYNRYQLHDYHL